MRCDRGVPSESAVDRPWTRRRGRPNHQIDSAHVDSHSGGPPWSTQLAGKMRGQACKPPRPPAGSDRPRAPEFRPLASKLRNANGYGGAWVSGRRLAELEPRRRRTAASAERSGGDSPFGLQDVMRFTGDGSARPPACRGPAGGSAARAPDRFDSDSRVCLQGCRRPRRRSSCSRPGRRARGGSVA
jgi:hypothetical protein